MTATILWLHPMPLKTKRAPSTSPSTAPLAQPCPTQLKPETDNKYCSQQALGPFAQSYLYVGVNPPWDSNPFFFEPYHLTSGLNSGFFTFANDSIYNLDFTAAAYACWADDGTPCGLIKFDYHFVGEELLNLNMSKIEKVKVGQEDGYNSSHFTWSDSTLFTYSVTFSNSTATASITTNITNSSMTLSFTGDCITNFTAGYPQLELDTSDSSMPHFRYINGNSIRFKDTSSTWKADATPFPTASSTSVLRTGTTTTAPLLTKTISAGQPIKTGGARVGIVRNSQKGASIGVLILSLFGFLAI
ncbi:uncharacterized protein K441DRAFT_680971 [Cenococcum geophilum 1.58]|uniref:uncharacterized protein n=1 Tax=Cenococcum geophilum 1.58 TaxID=794803 RepID=UPI00358EE616|nr:hypothetical protein K441DRAFT_680971 [Cenococcum geophilum 1.58]